MTATGHGGGRGPAAKGRVVVAVAGGGRASGKTALICSLLGHFPGAAAVKWSHHEAAGGPPVTDDPGAVLVRGKDTLRMKEAGAGKVIIVWGGGGGAAEKLRKALALAGGLSPVFIEGGAAFDHAGTDLRIFVESSGRGGGGKEGPGRRAKAHVAASLKNLGAEKISLLVRKLMAREERDMMRAVLRRVRGGVISCAAARRAAAETKAAPERIGRLCTETGIRIDDCVLGCFGRYKEKRRSIVAAVRRGLDAKQKVWMEKHGRLVMGEGRSKLLRAVREEGSINRAAKACGISYRRAWAMIHSIEQAAGRKIVETSIGGPSGGGTRITAFGKELLRYYDKLATRAQRVLEEEMRYDAR